jgi:hypothetical protein
VWEDIERLLYFMASLKVELVILSLQSTGMEENIGFVTINSESLLRLERII